MLLEGWLKIKPYGATRIDGLRHWRFCVSCDFRPILFATKQKPKPLPQTSIAPPPRQARPISSALRPAESPPGMPKASGAQPISTSPGLKAGPRLGQGATGAASDCPERAGGWGWRRWSEWLKGRLGARSQSTRGG